MSRRLTALLLSSSTLLLIACDDAGPSAAPGAGTGASPAGGAGTVTGGAPASGTGGAPACPLATLLCAGTCTDVTSSASNCGACGVACGAGEVCAAGACSCAPGLIRCGTACVDTRGDGANCGACAVACASGQLCANGSCASECPAGQAACGSSCVELLTSVLHCGACDAPCAAGQVCGSGSCGCPTGQTACGAACVNLLADALNCGACGSPCPTGAQCVSGGCLGGSGGSGGGASGAGGTLSGGAGGTTGGDGPGGSTPSSGGSGATGGDGGASGGSGGASGGAGGLGGAAGGACTPPAPGSRGTNPLFTDQYTADPAPMVHDCTFYITCGHDEGSTGFVMREWFVLKSSDMVNWTKTVRLRLGDFAWANANAWAGQMVEKGGKFYWYVPVNKRGSGMAIGVAVADSPDGPFQDAIGNSLIDDAFEMQNWGFSDPGQTPYTIDPTVFVDDDGQAYLQYGGFGRLVVARLNPDMISINGRLAESTPQGFFEAPHLFKRDGRYYVVYARDANPAKIDWATSNSPLGPWTYGGRILDSLPNVPGQDAATNHAGVAELAGQWYLVYHVSNGPNNGGTYRREVAVDKLFFNPDGSIQHVTPSSGMTF